MADPQTSGGLLIAVSPAAADEVKQLLVSFDLYAETIGTMTAQHDKVVYIKLG